MCFLKKRGIKKVGRVAGVGYVVMESAVQLIEKIRSGVNCPRVNRVFPATVTFLTPLCSRRRRPGREGATCMAVAARGKHMLQDEACGASASALRNQTTTAVGAVTRGCHGYWRY